MWWYAYSFCCNFQGGFSLLAAKYGQDYGIAMEKCNPYIAKKSACDKACTERTLVSSYEYIGGYYGNCTEAAMMEALYKYGPISVDFEVTLSLL